MKHKIWAVALLSLAGLAMSTTSAHAWLLNHWCRHCYTTQLNIRPYNAFTPICSGNLVCDGCAPNLCSYASGCASPGMSCGMPAPVSGAVCPGSSCAWMMPAQMPMAYYMPMQAPAQTAQQQYPAPYYGVQPAAYVPNYGYNPYMFTGYNPYGYQPNMMYQPQYYGYGQQ
jgi:hypothetical protein